MALQSAAHIIHKTAQINSQEDLETFYVMGEGDSNKNLPPFVAKIHFDALLGTISLIKQTELAKSNQRIHGVNPIAHHGGTTPDGKYFFATILDGKTYILNTTTMNLIKVIQTGLGAAHVNFSKEENVAVITSHFEDYITLIDLTTLEVKSKITISKTKLDQEHPALLQLHNPIISQDGRYFLTAASHDGDIVKVDLRNLEIDSKLHVGGILDQTSS
jgi:WD40 repeat protein